MRLLPALAFAMLLGCGPTRDESFTKLAQFTTVSRLSASALFVYFTEAGALKRVATSGGAVTTLLTTQTNDFAVGGAHVFAATTAGVFRVSENNPMPAQLSPEVALAVAADANGVSWADCTHLTHARIDGRDAVSTQLPAASCSVNGTRLALDASTVYGVDRAGLWYASRSGGPITRFSSVLCDSLAVGSGWVYCGNADGVWRVWPASGRSEQRATGATHDLAAAGDHLFVALDDDLTRLGQSNDDRLVLGTYANITAVTAANGRVYFVNTEGALGLLLSTSQ